MKITAFFKFRRLPNVKKIQGLNLPDPQGPVQACSGTALLFALLCIRQDIIRTKEHRI